LIDSINVLDPAEMSEGQVNTILGLVMGGGKAFSAAGRALMGSFDEIASRSALMIGARSVGTCSFDGNTLVKTNLGYTSIKDLRQGEHMVWARDEETGNMSYKDIMAQYSNQYAETVYVSIRNQETGSVQTITSNRIHPFFVKLPAGNDNIPPSSEGHDYKGDIENGQWVDAQFLAPGYLLLNEDEDWSEVVEIKITKEPLQAYNLTVADFSTYFVKGAANDKDDAIWVHNTCLGKNWKPRDINNSANWNGCEACALKIKGRIGGEIHRITPNGAPSLGGYRGKNPGWGHHEVVVKDGLVFDAFGPKNGVPIDEYKRLFQYPEAINFGF